MREHLHFYTVQGRCISSIVLQQETIHHSVETSLPTRIQFRLLSAGYRLHRWLESEQAGIATADGVEYILRVKSDGTMRDMRPLGASETLAAIRRDGLDVQVLTGLVT